MAKCSSRQILKEIGCQDCEDYTKPQDFALRCGPDECTGTQKLLVDGTCVNCPSGQLSDVGDNTRCVPTQNNCNQFQIK